MPATYMTKETIRIVVCGDDNVGKTSLLVSLLKNEFIPNLQDVLSPITIPRDFSSDPDSPISTVIIDTNNEDTQTLQTTLKLADVIWLVYSDHESYERISFHWMMMFRSLGLNNPVILCKNKCDATVDDDTTLERDGISTTHQINSYNTQNTKVEDEEFIPILMEFKEIDTCIKASAKTKYNVNQAFYLCQRAITHPIAPLFDARTGDLKPLAIEALQRIFLLCDNDQDGYLNDEEMQYLQRKCFHKEIDVNELEYIKQNLMITQRNYYHEEENHVRDGDHTLNSHCQLYVPGVGITLEGFLTINKMYVEKGRHETIWGILRTFKYTNSLYLDENFLHPRVNVSDSSSVELSSKGYRFLVSLFVKFDRDKDGGLDDNELEYLFKTTPGLPKLWSSSRFPYSTVVNNRGSITLQGWLAQWTMTTYIDHRIVTEYLVYFGFEEDTRLALQITRARRHRRRQGKVYRSSVSDRKVFNCYIFGKKFTGKTTLLEMFLGRQFTDSYEPTTKPQIAVNSLELKGGKQYYLILQEFGESDVDVLSNNEKLKTCDVICLTYDSSDPDSFSYILELFSKYERIKCLPILIVGLKADLDKQQQRCHIQPDDFCEKMFLNHPLYISSKWLSSLNELFIKITEAALTPERNTPDLPEKAKKAITDIDHRQTAVIVGSSIGFVTLLSYTLFKLAKSRLDRH
ncbi:mitochondrial Rho GTPase 1 [Monosporozyma servazzii]